MDQVRLERLAQQAYDEAHALRDQRSARLVRVVEWTAGGRVSKENGARHDAWALCRPEKRESRRQRQQQRRDPGPVLPDRAEGHLADFDPCVLAMRPRMPFTMMSSCDFPS